MATIACCSPAVEGALAGDRDVGLSESVDQRRVIVAVIGFPARQHAGIFGLGSVLNRSVAPLAMNRFTLLSR